MGRKLKTVAMWLAIVLVVVATFLILLPLLVRLLIWAVGLSLRVLQVIGLFMFLVGMLLLFWILAEAFYKVFLRPSVRVRRIRKIRNHRLMIEAVARNNTGLE